MPDEKVGASEDEKWQAMMMSARKACKIIGVEFKEPDYLNWRVGPDYFRGLWREVYKRNPSLPREKESEMVTESQVEHVTIDQLVDNAPDVININTLKGLKTTFELTKQRAESCAYGEMADDLGFIADKVNDIIDEMAYAFKKGRIESKDYDDYVKKIESFHWGTVPKMIKETLVDKCSCRQ